LERNFFGSSKILGLGSASKDDLIRDGPGLVTRSIIELYTAAMRGELEKFSGNQDRDVREVAFVLATIRQLLERELRAGFATAGLPGTPILGGLAMIDALTSGRDHPIHRHLAGLRSGRFRPQNAPPNRMEELGRVVVVGLVRAYEVTAKVPRLAAIKAVSEACRFEDFEFGIEQIKRWDRTCREQQDLGPDAFANRFIERAAELRNAIQAGDARAAQFAGHDAGELVLAVGRMDVWRMWAVPGATGDA
jgi:hypothetical protein